MYLILLNHTIEIIAHKKNKNKKVTPRALPGNRTRVARMGILNDTTTPAVLGEVTDIEEHIIKFINRL